MKTVPTLRAVSKTEASAEIDELGVTNLQAEVRLALTDIAASATVSLLIGHLQRVAPVEGHRAQSSVVAGSSRPDSTPAGISVNTYTISRPGMDAALCWPSDAHIGKHCPHWVLRVWRRSGGCS